MPYIPTDPSDIASGNCGSVTILTCYNIWVPVHHGMCNMHSSLYYLAHPVLAGNKLDFDIIKQK